MQRLFNSKKKLEAKFHVTCTYHTVNNNDYTMAYVCHSKPDLIDIFKLIDQYRANLLVIARLLKGTTIKIEGTIGDKQISRTCNSTIDARNYVTQLSFHEPTYINYAYTLRDL